MTDDFNTGSAPDWKQWTIESPLANDTGLALKSVSYLK